MGNGGPLLQEISLARKATATNRIDSKANDLEARRKKCCYFLFNSKVTFLKRSMDFYAVKCLIQIFMPPP